MSLYFYRIGYDTLTLGQPHVSIKWSGLERQLIGRHLVVSFLDVEY